MFSPLVLKNASVTYDMYVMYNVYRYTHTQVLVIYMCILTQNILFIYLYR